MKLKNISKSYNEIQVIKDLNLGLKPGEVVILQGPNGSGKTTILNIVAGLEKPDKGILERTKEEKLNLRYLFQKGNLLPWLKVIQNLKITFKHQNKKESYIDGFLDKYGISKYKYQYPNSLSGGTKQKVSLISVFSNQPKLLLLDEPLHYLDQNSIKLTINIIKSLKLSGSSIIIASHNLDKFLELKPKILDLK